MLALDIIAREIMEDFEAALEQFRAFMRI